jgi:deoxyribose-phosphate aldolase
LSLKQLTVTKVFEARQTIHSGAEEIDIIVGTPDQMGVEQQGDAQAGQRFGND